MHAHWRSCVGQALSAGRIALNHMATFLPKICAAAHVTAVGCGTLQASDAAWSNWLRARAEAGASWDELQVKALPALVCKQTHCRVDPVPGESPAACVKSAWRPCHTYAADVMPDCA